MDTIVKECTACKQVKEASFFDASNTLKSGLRSACKACRKLRRKRDAEKIRERKRRYYQKNKEEIDRKNRKWEEDNRDKYLAQKQRWRDANREHYNEVKRSYHKRRVAADPAYRLRHRVSTSIYQSLRKLDMRRSSATWEALPYTPAQLKEHIESQFEDWMTWDNWGTWHIDHIYPHSKLPYDSFEHPNFQKCWALENLRPLCAIENLKKSDKIVETETSYKEPIEKEE